MAPLGVLPTLKHLLLVGQFQQLHCLAGLTRLECSEALVSGVGEFAPNLQYLRAVDSHLLGIHTQGLSSCTALTQLILNVPHLEDNNENMYLDSALSLVPSNIGLLTQLHTLELGTDSEAQDVANLQWITELTSLQI